MYTHLSRLASLVLLLCSLIRRTTALSFPIESRTAGPSSYSKSLHVDSRRDGQLNEIGLANYEDLQYTTEVTVGGRSFTVLLVTGSSDLVIFDSFNDSGDSDIPVTVNISGQAYTGVISNATIEFGGYTLPNQTFNHVKSLDAFPQPPFQQNGMFGLGPSTGSIIWQSLQSSLSLNLPALSSESLLDRIFLLNASIPNYTTLYLARDDLPSAYAAVENNSILTIGEVLSQFTDIASAPRVSVVNSSLSGSPILLDSVWGNGGLGDLPVSAVPGTPPGKLVAIIDSSFAFSQVPLAVAEQLYLNTPYSQWDLSPDSGPKIPVWVLPCDEEVTAAFVFEGETYSMHPLDLNMNTSEMQNYESLGDGMCFAGFQPIQQDIMENLNGQADIVLGANFLRNVYTLIDYGTFSSPPSVTRTNGSAYVQFLSVTNATLASVEFDATRGQSQQTAPAVFPNGSSSPPETFVVLLCVLVPLFFLALVVLWVYIKRREGARKGKAIVDEELPPYKAAGASPPPYAPSPSSSISTTPGTNIELRPLESPSRSEERGEAACRELAIVEYRGTGVGKETIPSLTSGSGSDVTAPS